MNAPRRENSITLGASRGDAGCAAAVDSENSNELSGETMRDRAAVEDSKSSGSESRDEDQCI